MDDLLAAVGVLHRKLAHDDGLNGPQTSLVDSETSGAETKKPRVSPGFDVICQLLSEAGFSQRVGDAGLEPATPCL